MKYIPSRDILKARSGQSNKLPDLSKIGGATVEEQKVLEREIIALAHRITDLAEKQSIITSEAHSNGHKQMKIFCVTLILVVIIAFGFLTIMNYNAYNYTYENGGMKYGVQRQTNQ